MMDIVYWSHPALDSPQPEIFKFLKEEFSTIGEVLDSHCLGFENFGCYLQLVQAYHSLVFSLYEGKYLLHGVSSEVHNALNHKRPVFYLSRDSDGNLQTQRFTEQKFYDFEERMSETGRWISYTRLKKRLQENEVAQ